jgi:hypothetical protein
VKSQEPEFDMSSGAGASNMSKITVHITHNKGYVWNLKGKVLGIFVHVGLDGVKLFLGMWQGY